MEETSMQVHSHVGFIITPEMLQNLEVGGIIPSNTPAAQAAIFAQVCKEKGLSPFSKEIYLVCYKGTYTRIVGIDGCRKIAARTKAHAGTDDAKFDLKPDGSFLTHAQIKEANRAPLSATVTVYRIVGGLRCPFTFTAVFSEYNGNVQKWLTMPINQISKCAEMGALKKAFSDELSGLNVEEERYAFENTQNAIILPPKVEVKQLPEMTRAHFDQYIFCKLTGDEENAALIEKSVIITDKWNPFILRDLAKSRLNPESDFETIQALKDGDLDVSSIVSKFFFTVKELTYYSTIFKQRQEEKDNGKRN